MKSNNKSFEVIVLSAFGRQAELPATSRILSLLKGFYENEVKVHLVIPDLPFLSEANLSNFQVHLIKKDLLQKMFFFALTGIKKLLKKKSSSEKYIKPVYKKGSGLMSYYAFFFYSSTPIPFFKTYKLAKKISKRILEENITPVIITSVNPGCYLFAGKLLKSYFGNRIVWIADYQDPIENDPFLEYKSNRIIQIANDFTFKFSDAIIAPEESVIETLEKTARNRGLSIRNKCYVLKPGINPHQSPRPPRKKGFISIVYGGTLYYERVYGLKALLNTIKNFKDFEFIYAGATPEIVQDLRKELKISAIKIFEVLPKPQFEKLLEESDVHLVLGTFGSSYNAPGGKLYSLLGYDKPLLIISPKTKELIEMAEKAGGVYLTEANEQEILEVLEQIRNDLNTKSNFRNLEFIEKNSDKQIVRRFISEFLQEALRNDL